ncbi:hypothetical protein V5O48_010655 [Marasmius crinis-equi]|uniref:Uncharacterized protein n=1 Tax=Marasmius crinis-equi TaxID=585013 RepID=A0ABR3F7S1_9AGAR
MLKHCDHFGIKGSNVVNVDGHLSGANINASYRPSKRHYKNRYITNNHGNKNVTYNDSHIEQRGGRSQGSKMVGEASEGEDLSEDEPGSKQEEERRHQRHQLVESSFDDLGRQLNAKRRVNEPRDSRGQHHSHQTGNRHIPSESTSGHFSTYTQPQMQRPHMPHATHSNPLPYGPTPSCRDSCPSPTSSAPPVTHSNTNPFDEVYLRDFNDQSCIQQTEPSRNPYHRFMKGAS